MQLQLCGHARHHRDQVEEAIGDMERDDAVGLQVAQIRLERLARDEVHRNRVAREGVDREHVEALRRLALERETRVTQRGLGARGAVAEKAELAARDLDDVRVDVVEAVAVARAPVRGDGARAQADHPDAHRMVLLRMDRRTDA